MKKIVLNTFMLFAVLGLAFAFHNYSNSHKSISKPSVLSNGGEDIDGYVQWEHQRLADPATGRIPDNIRALELAFASNLPNDLQRDNRMDASLAAVWQMRGPWNVGGRTRSFAADVKNEAVLLAGTAAGGMWRSADSGKSWALTTKIAQEQSVTCLAQDTRTTNNHSNVWYYGSGECFGASASATGAYYLGNGLYRSVDNGQTWSVLTSTSINSTSFSNFWQAIWSVATDPSQPDSLSVVYVTTIGEVNRSKDSGRTWKTLLGGNYSSYSYYTNVIVTPEGVVYVTLSSDGPQRGIWRSTDGLNYTNITPPNFPTTYNRIVMNYAPTDHNQLYFLANTPGFGSPDTNFQHQVEWNSLWKYKYLSGNGDSAGGAWTDLSPNLPSTGSVFDKFNCQGSYDMVVTFLPTDTSTVFIGGTSIFRSTSGFYDTSHTAHIGGYAVHTTVPNIQRYPGHHPDQHILFFSASNPYIMYSGNDGGIYKTMDDTLNNISWNSLNNGYATTMLYTVNSNHETSGSPILVGGAQDNNSLFDNSLASNNLWTKPVFGDGSFSAIADSGKVFYYENTLGWLFKTQMDTVNGTVVAFNRMDPIGGKNYEWLNPYVIDPNNDYIMYFAGGKYLWRNSNLSAIPLSNMWDSISTNWVKWTDSVPAVNSDITAMAVSNVPAHRVYYGTSNKSVYRVDNANVGTPTPTDVTEKVGYSSFPPNAFVTCVAVDPANADKAIVVYSNYGIKNLFYTYNGGATWARIGGNLNGTNQPSLRWAAFQDLPSGKTIYWVAASTGLYATDTLRDSVTVWVQQASNTIGNSVCDMIDVRQSDGLVAVATHTRGAYTANITDVSQIATISNIAPQALNLKAEIYPNPTSGKATVSYFLPEEGTVQLKIYDQRGNLIQQSQLSNAHKGGNITTVDLSNQAAGVYFCNIITKDEVKTLRMLVVK